MSGPVDMPNEETCSRCHGDLGWSSPSGIWTPCPDCDPAPSPAGDLSEQETLTELLAAHEDVSFDLTTPRQYTQHGGWNRNCGCGHPLPDSGADDEVFYTADRRHLAQILAARNADLTRRAARDALLRAARGMGWEISDDPGRVEEFLRAYADENYPEDRNG